LFGGEKGEEKEEGIEKKKRVKAFIHLSLNWSRYRSGRKGEEVNKKGKERRGWDAPLLIAPTEMKEKKGGGGGGGIPKGKGKGGID